MMEYSNAEYYDMLMCLGSENGNSTRAAMKYAEQYPNRRHPDRRVIDGVARRLHSTGQLRANMIDTGRRPLRTIQMQENILQSFHEDPQLSVRYVGRHFNIPHQVVWRTLKDDGQHPYHFRCVQALLPDDLLNRREFCHWLLQANDQNPAFIGRILWTDESMFSRDGMFNSRNEHTWAHANPHAKRPSHFQHRWTLNVWAGIVGDRVLGPCFLPPRMSSQLYLDFLQNELQELLDDLPLIALRQMWFQQDGAPPHYGRQVRTYLDREFEGRWIGRGGPIPWPPRSPDLTPLDFFLWSYIKQKVYKTYCPDVETLRERIIDAFNEVKINVNILRNVQLSIVKRSQLCVQENGDNFEQFL
jgi:hypothetical protein